MQLGTGVCLQERYFLMEVLGIGGTSTVFLAMDERIQRKRAVKAIRKAKFSGQRLWEKKACCSNGFIIEILLRFLIFWKMRNSFIS